MGQDTLGQPASVSGRPGLGFRVEHEALGFIPGVVEHTCKPNTWEVEAEGTEIQGCSQLSREFEANLGYVKLCLRKNYTHTHTHHSEKEREGETETEMRERHTDKLTYTHQQTKSEGETETDRQIGRQKERGTQIVS